MMSQIFSKSKWKGKCLNSDKKLLSKGTQHTTDLFPGPGVLQKFPCYKAYS